MGSCVDWARVLMPSLANALCRMGFHRVRRDVQLRGDVAVGRALRDRVDDLNLGVGEAVPARFRRLADNATLHTLPAQSQAHPARIGERFVVQAGVECGIQLIQRPVTPVGVCEFSAGVLGGCSVKKRPRRRVKHVRRRPAALRPRQPVRGSRAHTPATHGDAVVPTTYTTDDGSELGKWVDVQRNFHWKGTLDADRERRLKEVPGWTWSGREASWEEGFSQLLDYVKRNGDARVPANKADEDYPAQWVGPTQRHFHAKGMLDADRERRLRSWPVGCGMGATPSGRKVSVDCSTTSNAVETP